MSDGSQVPVFQDHLVDWLKQTLEKGVVVHLGMPKIDLIRQEHVVVHGPVDEWTIQPGSLGDEIRDESFTQHVSIVVKKSGLEWKPIRDRCFELAEQVAALINEHDVDAEDDPIWDLVASEDWTLDDSGPIDTARSCEILIPILVSARIRRSP